MSTWDMRQLHSPSTSTEAPREESDRAGELIDGRYRLERLIACGGSGMIYLSTELATQQKSAVKVIATRLKQFDPELAQRFREEAQRCARLIHPGVAMIYDYGETEHGDLFIAMEHVDGRPLAQVIAVEGPLSIERILRIAVRVARALKHAHDQGVLHRDLKPSKIILVGEGEDDDRIKLLDVGVAGLLTGERGRWGIADSQDSPFGSPKYLSPEQIRGETLDARSDMYAFGSVLFCMITGVPPFLGSRAVEIAEQHLRVRPAPMETVGYKRPVPHPVFAIVSRCLEKARENRFASMAQLITELKIAYQASVGKPLVIDDAQPEDIDEGSGRTPLPLQMNPDPSPLEAAMMSRTVSDTETSMRERRVQGDLAEAMRMSKRLPPEPPTRVRSDPDKQRSTSQPRLVGDPRRKSESDPVPVPMPMPESDPDMKLTSLPDREDLLRSAPDMPLPPQTTPVPAPSIQPNVQPAALSPPIVVTARPPKLPWAIAAISLATAIAAVLSLYLAPVREAPRPAPDPSASLFEEAKIAFESVPRGARVEEQGVIIGITPLIRTYPRSDEKRHFIFILDGYGKKEMDIPLDQERIAVRAVLEKR